MSNSFEAVIKISLDRYGRGRQLLPKKLGNEAVNHFKDNWRKQGFDDQVVNPWKNRKRLDAGRAILVKSGRLRRSFTVNIEGVNRIYVVNPTPYGIYHNYGTKRLPQRKFMGRSRNLDEKSGVLIMRMMKQALQ